MVIDETDIDRIEKAVIRLETKIEAKLDVMDIRYLARTEYEARTIIIQAEIAKMTLDTSQRSDRINDKLDKIQEHFTLDIQSMRTEVSQVSTDKWKLIAYGLIGALTSGGILGLIDVIRIATGH